MNASPIALFLLACNPPESAPPPQIVGLWQVHQVERTSGVLDGGEVALLRFPACSWARQTWNFEGTRMRVEHDVLCPSSVGEEYVACQVAAVVPAEWDAELGKWRVAHGARARSTVTAMESGAFELPTACTVEIAAGEYEVARVPGEDWRWEMSIPSGNVLRLKIPESDDPDFVMAMRKVRGEPDLEVAP